MSAAVMNVLLVEDNPADQRLALEAFKQSRYGIKPSVVQDGEEALAFLDKRGKFCEAPFPELILLDLNLPGLDGRQVLAHVRQHPKLRRIPVVVLTSSQANEDVRKCYDLCANSYVIKPADLDEFFDVMRGIEDYWFGLAVRPSA